MNFDRADEQSSSSVSARGALTIAVALLAWSLAADGHDIPNARVDRSIQVDVKAGRLRVDYELGLSELTLTQDLRALIGSLPGADRRGWFDRYGKVVGPLNAAGLEVIVDGRPLTLRTLGYDLAITDHPRYTFHFEADLPPGGRLVVRDTNYGAGEGTSRLAIRGVDGVAVKGDDLPGDVSRIAICSPWQMSGVEEKRTRQVEVEFGPGGSRGGVESDRASPEGLEGLESGPSLEGLSRLLDASEISVLGLFLIAFGLGAAHAIQPGHGKSLVAAASIGEHGGWSRGMALAVIITASHMGGVLTVAMVLWLTGATSYIEINRRLAQAAGFLIATIGFWRLGRHLGGHSEHPQEAEAEAGGVPRGARSLLGLGLAGGMVPCWDAVVLVLLAEAIDQLGLGLVLLSAFSLGMATVLVAVGVIAGHLRGLIGRSAGGEAWARRLGILGSAAIATIGLYMMAS